MLKIENLLLTYGTLPVFSGMSLEVDRGEIVCLCGESGSGKSSMLKSIQGFVDAEGSIEVDGKVLDVNTVDAIRQKIAYVPQDISLPYDTVEQMVMSLFELRLNRNIRFSKEMMLADWSQLGLDSSLWDKRINEISGGQRQRIMLSVAGLTGKCLLLADEPTSALDSESALLVANYFRMLARERNMAILVVSHSETFAKECDRVVKF
jgi:polar amino acid transport system ATP-binding protein/putative ABC transport system ATP-binding protein